jgi:hypothetical protein
VRLLCLQVLRQRQVRLLLPFSGTPVAVVATVAVTACQDERFKSRSAMLMAK